MKSGIWYCLLLVGTAAQHELEAPSKALSAHWNRHLRARHIGQRLERRGGSKKTRKPSSSNSGSSGKKTSSGDASSARTGGSVNSTPRGYSASSASLASDSQGRTTENTNKNVIPEAQQPGLSSGASSSSGRRVELPYAPPPIPPFTSARTSPPKPVSSKQRKSVASKSGSLDEEQIRLTKLRLTQDSGASQSFSGPSDTDPHVFPGIAPKLETSSTSPKGSRGSSPNRKAQRSSPPSSLPPPPPQQQPQSSSRSQPLSQTPQTRMGPPARIQVQPSAPPLASASSSRVAIVQAEPQLGVTGAWLENQRKRIQTYKKLGNQPTAGIEDLENKQLTANNAVRESRARESLARAARSRARTDSNDAVQALATGRPLSPSVDRRVNTGLNSVAAARDATFAHHNAAATASGALQVVKQYGDAARYGKKSARAFARQDLHNTYGRALEYKWSDAVNSDPTMVAKGEKVGPYAAKSFYSTMYRMTAQNYHKAHSGYEDVNGVISGSSSDESEKDTFRDVVPRRPRPGA